MKNEKRCPQCKKEFVGRKNQIYCSTKCRVYANRMKALHGTEVAELPDEVTNRLCPRCRISWFKRVPNTSNYKCVSCNQVIASRDMTKLILILKPRKPKKSSRPGAAQTIIRKLFGSDGSNKPA